MITTLRRAVLAATLTLAAAACAPGVDGASTPGTSSPGDNDVEVSAGKGAADLLATLPIAAEDTAAVFHRADWGGWTDQGEGCDTRAMMLREQGEHTQNGDTLANAVVDPSTCSPLAGHANLWFSLYDLAAVADPADLVVEPLVPLEEMTRSGAASWTATQRQDYLNDADNLVVVTATSSLRRSGRGPAEWAPGNDFDCEYAKTWIVAKTAAAEHTGQLVTVDPAERDALARLLNTCDR
jgi:hypothetical protein